MTISVKRLALGACMLLGLAAATFVTTDAAAQESFQVLIIDPNALDLFARPIGAADCDPSVARPLQVQLNYNTRPANVTTTGQSVAQVRVAYPSAQVTIFPAQGTSCASMVEETPLENGRFLLNTSPTPDVFPRSGSNLNILSTRTFLDLAEQCDGEGGFSGPPINLTDYSLCVSIDTGAGTTVARVTGRLPVRIDTKAPEKITNVTADGGSESITVSWSIDTSETNIDIYSVTVTNVNDESDTRTETVASPTSTHRVAGLGNGQQYFVTVTATDTAGNVSEPSDAIVAQPEYACDFWNCYGGPEQGGFCFIATAAYGSYDAPFVQTFRLFRQHVLAKSAPGRAFIRWYYANGRAPAAWLWEHPIARRAVAVALLLPYMAVWPAVSLRPWLAALVYLGVSAALAALALRVGRRRRALRMLPLAGLVLLVGVGAPSSALAQADDEFHVERETYSAVTPQNMPPPRFELAIKLSPYYPAMGRDRSSGYSVFFGQADGLFSEGANLRIDASGDVYFLRKFGLLGVNGTAGFWQIGGPSKACPGTTCDSLDNLINAPRSGDFTHLTIFPLSVGLVYKFDLLWRQWKVPLVPFVRAGIDGYIWKVDASGRQARRDDAPPYTHSLRANGYAQGLTLGWHVNPGLSFALDWLEPNAARRAYTFMGLKGSYLTIEWMFASVNDFGSPRSWDLSSSTFLAGLAVEL